MLQRIRGVEDVDAEFDDIVEAVAVAQSVTESPYRTILRRRYLPQLVISILIPTFQQFTGINAIMFYAPQLFQAVGQGEDASLLNTVIMGSVNVISTLVAIWAVDRCGPAAACQCLLFLGWAVVAHVSWPAVAAVSSQLPEAMMPILSSAALLQVRPPRAVPDWRHPDGHLRGHRGRHDQVQL